MVVPRDVDAPVSSVIGMVQRSAGEQQRGYPGLLDVLDLGLVRLAKIGRQKHGDSVAFYESFFTPYDVVKYAGDARHRWRYGVMRRLFDELFPDGRARVADVGCGLGMSLLYLPDHVEFMGIEHSRETVALARSIHARRAAVFCEGGFPELPLETAACDFCVCLEVLEHLADDQPALDELHRIIRPGGFLLISVPGGFYWRSYRRLIGHFRHYKGPALCHTLRDRNFAVVKHLSQFPRLWQCYHYLYVLFRLFEATIQRVGHSTYRVYESWLYRRLSTWTLTWLERRQRDDEPESTFLLCRRQIGGA